MMNLGMWLVIVMAVIVVAELCITLIPAWLEDRRNGVFTKKNDRE